MSLVAAPPGRARAASHRAVAVAVLPAPRRAPPPRRARVRVATPVRRARRVRRSVLLAATATVTAVLALVAFQVMTAQSQLTLDRIDRQVVDAQRRYDQARLGYAQLAAPSRIVARAGQLGLVPPAAPPIPVPVPSSRTGVVAPVSTRHAPRP